MERVLGELSLEEHADTRIGSLSGGQRKRTGVATELLSRPSVLFLDEPTTGLDPGLETQMMQLLRELSRGGRAVAVVTHATKNLAMCDRVVVMGRGGYLTFDGPPAEARRVLRGRATTTASTRAAQALSREEWRRALRGHRATRGRGRGARGARRRPTSASGRARSPARACWCRAT